MRTLPSPQRSPGDQAACVVMLQFVSDISGVPPLEHHTGGTHLVLPRHSTNTCHKLQLGKNRGKAERCSIGKIPLRGKTTKSLLKARKQKLMWRGGVLQITEGCRVMTLDCRTFFSEPGVNWEDLSPGMLWPAREDKGSGCFFVMGGYKLVCFKRIWEM